MLAGVKEKFCFTKKFNSVKLIAVHFVTGNVIG
jgi:hypothetical protein